MKKKKMVLVIFLWFSWWKVWKKFKAAKKKYKKIRNSKKKRIQKEIEIYQRRKKVFMCGERNSEKQRNSKCNGII